MKIYLTPLMLVILSLGSLRAESIEEKADRELVDNEAVKVYGGKVGKLPAIFHIEWMGEDVMGRYYHPARGKDKFYLLEGKNPAQGVLVLKEYTPLGVETRKHTATIYLNKKVIKGRIVWSGTMHNTDGRKFAVSFSRKGAKPRNTDTPEQKTKPEKVAKTCATCSGTGRLRDNEFTQWVECGDCDGKGKR